MDQVDTTKPTSLFLDTCQRRKDRQRGKLTETQSSRMYFTKKRNLLVEKKQPGEKESFKETQREND